MSKLIPEARPDKNGTVVTRWVKGDGPIFGSTLNVPAPSIPRQPQDTVEDRMLSDLGTIINVQDHGGRGTVYLKDMEDPEIASGNCWKITSEAIEMMDFHEYGLSGSPDFANAQGSAEKDGINIEHYAVFLSGPSETVVDFTIRQFDHEAPFPLITNFSDWSERMRSHLGPNVELSVGELDYDDDGWDEDEE
jgi:hypothetical protein